jgi:hypothetical protein
MTLIDSGEFRALANTLGTILFTVTILWILWFAFKMD